MENLTKDEIRTLRTALGHFVSDYDGVEGQKANVRKARRLMEKIEVEHFDR